MGSGCVHVPRVLVSAAAAEADMELQPAAFGLKGAGWLDGRGLVLDLLSHGFLTDSESPFDLREVPFLFIV